MSNVLLRVTGSVIFGLALGSALEASSIESAFITGSICLLFSTAGDSKK